MFSVLAWLLISSPAHLTAEEPAPAQARMSDVNFWSSRPVEVQPFVVVGVASARGVETAAFRSAYDPIDGTYYVAMRRENDGVAEADSRECDFTADLVSLRNLEMPEIRVPGTLPLQPPPLPQFQHFTWTVNLYRARQSDDQSINVTLSAGHGPIATWARTLLQKTSRCFQPLAG